MSYRAPLVQLILSMQSLMLLLLILTAAMASRQNAVSFSTLSAGLGMLLSDTVPVACALNLVLKLSAQLCGRANTM